MQRERGLELAVSLPFSGAFLSLEDLTILFLTVNRLLILNGAAFNIVGGFFVVSR
ncbi:MAG TPA: hypothetical protein PKD26_08430 [Pyrinomonadaceae bacterium]|nr:hypothetical protein [Pyrinomonadaceae bacterium]